MFAIVAPLYTSWVYVVISYIDYIRNRKAYITSELLPAAFDQLIQNVFVWIPLSLYLLLVAYPSNISIRQWHVEIWMLVIEFIFGEIWFYSLHRLCHYKQFYFLHKKHHEIREPVGMLAFYASPFEVTVMNAGNFIFTHIIFNHSQFHIIAIITIGLLNTILYSHSPTIKGPHTTHHRLHKFNFGHSLFMDRLLGTWLKPIKCN